MVEDHPKGIRRVERDDDRWEAAMGGIAGIIVTQFASPTPRGPCAKFAKLGHRLAHQRTESASMDAQIENRMHCTFMHCFPVVCINRRASLKAILMSFLSNAITLREFAR